MEPLYGPKVEARELRKQRAEEARRDKFFRSRPITRKAKRRQRSR